MEVLDVRFDTVDVELLEGLGDLLGDVDVVELGVGDDVENLVVVGGAVVDKRMAFDLRIVHPSAYEYLALS